MGLCPAGTAREQDIFSIKSVVCSRDIFISNKGWRRGTVVDFLGLINNYVGIFPLGLGLGLFFPIFLAASLAKITSTAF